MYRGFYLAANGMINQQRILDTISNNVANVKTAGYKRDTSIPDTFDRQLLLIRGKRNETGTIEYRNQEKVHTALEQGTFEFTESRLDVALRGNVFFNIEPSSDLYEDVEAPMLTRNGQFCIDNEGYLALGNAGRVLGEGGPIRLGTADFSIDSKGLITTADGDSYQLLLTYVDETEDVLKEGDNMFVYDGDGDTAIPENAEFDVIQGAYERSNVNVGEEMTKAIAAQRLFESCSQALKMIDSINQRTATEIAKNN